MLSVEIAQYLTEQGLVSFDTTGITGNAFIADLPDWDGAPDECVAIRQASAPSGDGTPHQTINIQVFTRGKQDPRTAQTLAQAISDKLAYYHGSAFVTGGTHIVHCWPMQDAPFYVGRDDNQRTLYSQNFQVLTAKEHDN